MRRRAAQKMCARSPLKPLSAQWASRGAHLGRGLRLKLMAHFVEHDDCLDPLETCERVIRRRRVEPLAWRGARSPVHLAGLSRTPPRGGTGRISNPLGVMTLKRGMPFLSSSSPPGPCGARDARLASAILSKTMPSEQLRPRREPLWYSTPTLATMEATTLAIESRLEQHERHAVCKSDV
jgi:hypothetical protein